MKKRSELEKKEIALFRDEFTDVVPIKQDKIPPPSLSIKQKTPIIRKNRQSAAEMKQAAASFHFSDGFEAHFDQNGPLKYTAPGIETHLVKQLRRGDFAPELILDLHGYKRDEAKLEIAALIHAATKEHVHCVCIVHGIGTRILKNSVPNWLIQHPDVLAFHQAPLEWGGKGALLVLIKLHQ